MGQSIYVVIPQSAKAHKVTLSLHQSREKLKLAYYLITESSFDITPEEVEKVRLDNFQETGMLMIFTRSNHPNNS